MQTYLGGYPVNVVIPLADEAGGVVPTSEISYRIIDQDDKEIVPKTVVNDYDGSGSLMIPVTAQTNTLPGDEVRALRIVELCITDNIGTIKIESGYFIAADEILVEGKNSFQGYSGALFLSFEIPNLSGWDVASKMERVAALIAARRNIGKLRFRYVFDAYQNIIDNTVGVSDLTMATVDQWRVLPDEFKSAVRRAQIIEADFLLGGDIEGNYRRSGIVSITTGEAKHFFRSIKSIEAAVCKRAMTELAKYVLSHTRLTRV